MYMYELLCTANAIAGCKRCFLLGVWMIMAFRQRWDAEMLKIRIWGCTCKLKTQQHHRNQRRKNRNQQSLHMLTGDVKSPFALWFLRPANLPHLNYSGQSWSDYMTSQPKKVTHEWLTDLLMLITHHSFLTQRIITKKPIDKRKNQTQSVRIHLKFVFKYNEMIRKGRTWRLLHKKPWHLCSDGIAVYLKNRRHVTEIQRVHCIVSTYKPLLPCQTSWRWRFRLL